MNTLAPPATADAMARVRAMTESNVLAGIFAHPHLFERTAGRLDAANFQHPTLQDVFKAMCAVSAQGQPITPLTVGETMAGKGADVSVLARLVRSGITEGMALLELDALAGPAPAEEPKRFFQGLDLSQYKAAAFLDAPLPDMRWVFEGFLLTANVCLLVGPPGTGKSYLATQLAAALAGGRGANGVLSPGCRGTVLVLAGEEDARIIPRRLKAVQDEFYPGSDPDALKGFRENLIVIPLAGKTIRLIEKAGGGAPVESQLFSDLMELCATIPDLKLIVVDPLSRAYGLNELDNSDATAFVVVLEKLAHATGAGVIAVHHVNKASSTRKGADKKTGYLNALEQEAARGGTGFVGAARAQMNIVGLKQEEAKALFKDHAAEDNHYLAVGFPKCSYGPPRPVLFLHRGPGGVLIPVERPAEVKERETRELILEWVKAKIDTHRANGMARLTTRTILNFSNELKAEVKGASQAELTATIGAALSTGELIEVEGKNSKGKDVDYLSLPTLFHTVGTLLERDTVDTADTVEKRPTVSEPKRATKFHTVGADTVGKKSNTWEPKRAANFHTVDTVLSKESEEVGTDMPLLPLSDLPPGPLHPGGNSQEEDHEKSGDVFRAGSDSAEMDLPEPPARMTEEIPLQELEPAMEDKVEWI